MRKNLFVHLRKVHVLAHIGVKGQECLLQTLNQCRGLIRVGRVVGLGRVQVSGRVIMILRATTHNVGIYDISVSAIIETRIRSKRLQYTGAGIDTERVLRA